VGVPENRTWTREGVGVVKVTPNADARNGDSTVTAITSHR